MAQLYIGLDNFFNLFNMIIFIRFMLTWFPNINWWNQPFKFLRDFCDPIFEPFRRIIPPIGGLDLSPMVLFAFLTFVLEPLILNTVKHFV